MRILTLLTLVSIILQFSGNLSDATAHESYFKYIDKMARKIEKNAQSRFERGQVIVRFKIGSDGRILNGGIVKSSGSKALDIKALNAIRRSSPFGHLPAPHTNPRSFAGPVKFGSNGVVVKLKTVGQKTDLALDYYRNNIRPRIRRSVRYFRKGGKALVRFTVAPSGKLLSYKIAKSSGIKEVDREALNIIKRAAPFGAMRGSRRKPQAFTLPISLISNKVFQLESYKKRISRHMTTYKGFRYIKNVKGTVTANVLFFVEKSGKIKSVRLLKRSRSRAFNREVIKMVRSISSLPPLPNGYKSPLKIVMPISYYIK